MLDQWGNKNLNFGRNTSNAKSDDPGSLPILVWFYNQYHSSSPTAPYKGAVRKGDVIPQPLITK
jgi:hypothetical protein